MLKKSCLLILLVATFSYSYAQYEIKITLDNFIEQELLLGYHYGDKQYIKDTVAINDKGEFIFSGEDTLKGGVYLIVMPPDNQYFQVIVDEGSTHFSVHANALNPHKDIKIKGSEDTQLFYDYMTYIAQKREKADAIRKEMDENADKDLKKSEKLKKQLDAVNEEVVIYQNKLIEKHPKTVAAAIVKAGTETKLPEFKDEDEDAIKLKRYYYFRNHYFDNIDLADPRLLRSPVLFPKVESYIDKVVPQHPDSISIAIDKIMDMVKPSEENYKFFLVYFINKYASSKIVGMDAVYVYIVENYYAKGLAPWTEEEQLEKMIKNAKTLKPLLIGKIAPDIQMQILDVEETLKEKDNENEYKRYKTLGPLALHEVKSPYTILFVWAPDCGHCKKAMPKVVEFYDNYKDKGIEIFAICTETYKSIPNCAEMIKEKNMIKWINVVDPYIRSKYKQIYDIRSTPQIYILDENKEIISKRIGAEQLSDVMDKILKMNEEQEKQENGK